MGNPLFNTVKMSSPSKNTFDLSHEVKLSCNMGDLIPILAMDVVPSDKVRLGSEVLLRMAPMLAPIMHRVDVSVHFFFVPNRILWPNWEKFITNDPSAPAHPIISYNQDAYESYPLIDYIGLPDPGTAIMTPYDVNALPFAAYQKIYNDYYRDQNLITEVPIELVDGSNNAIEDELWTLRKRAWEHDYFTSALPFAQKGDAVAIPLGEITLDPTWDTPAITPNPRFEKDNSSPLLAGTLQQGSGPGTESIVSNAEPNIAGAYDPAGTLINEATSINDLRRAFKLQEFLEKLARGGSRMIEVIKNFFGVNSKDARLQRPEYITGTKSPVTISEVLTTADTADAPAANMAGHGLSVTNGKDGSYYCEEHGWIIGIMSVLPTTAYFQGIDKKFSKTDNLDYYWPQFANIGEQPVYNKELYADTLTPEGIFGYLPRYTEYKYMQSRVAGEFKTTLDFWHMARKFAAPPGLNEAFINADPTHRIFAVTDPTEDKLWVMIYNSIKANRPMPKYGTPTF